MALVESSTAGTQRPTARRKVPWLIAAAIGLGLITYCFTAIAPPPSSRSLTGKIWQWTSYSEDGVGTVTIGDPEHYTIVFDADGTAHVTADCNKNGWSYYIAGSLARPRIALESHASRWSSCGPGSSAQLFVDHLWPTDTFRVNADRLELKRDHYGLSWTLRLKAVGVAGS
jgi:heat shock protein HslJ